MVVNIASILGQTPQYAAFRGMFDEAKLNGLRLRLTPLFQVGSPTEFSASMRPSLVYAWDRNGAPAPLAYDQVASYGSARSTSLAPGTSGIITSSIYATDLMERTVYFPTSQLTTLGDETVNAAAPFMPDFLVAVKLPGAAVASTTFAYQLELWADLTFRGVRFTAASL